LALIDGSSEYRYRGKDYCNYYFVDALSTEKGDLIILQTSLDWAVCRHNPNDFMGSQHSGSPARGAVVKL